MTSMCVIRSKSFYDDTTNTMRLSSIKSKLQNVSTSITNVNPFHKAVGNDAEESFKNAKEENKRSRRRKHKERRSASARSSEPSGSHDSKHRGRKREISPNRQHSSEVKKIVPNRTTMDYVVSVDDTLSSVAARFEMTPSELCQLNRLVCRSLFAGQIIKVPKAISDVTAQEPVVSGETGLADPQNIESRFYEDEGTCPPKIDDVLTDSYGRQDTELFRPYLSESLESESYSSSLDDEERSNDEADPMDAKYLKVQAEFVIDLKISISGQILITTNSFVFTPNSECVTDPNQYHLLLPLARIRSVAVYKDHSVLYFTKRDSHLVSTRLHSGGRTKSKSRSPLASETLSPPLHTEIQDPFQLAESVEPVEASPSPDLMDTGLPDTSIGDTPLVVDQKAETISQQGDSVLKDPLSSNTVVIPSDSDSMEYLCVLASKEDAIGKRHPVWFTLQSEEYWFRIPVEKGPVLFHFLQACEFDEEAVDEKLLPTAQFQLHDPAIHECMTSPAELCEATTNSGTGGFVSVPNTYDWLLPRIGSVDERSRALLRLSRKRRRRVQSCKQIVSNAASIDQSMVSSTHSVCSLGADTDTNSNVSKQQKNLSAARSTPTLDEEKDALHLLKKESVRWEWIPTAFQHAWEHFVHWLVNSNEIKLQEAEEKRRQFIQDSLKLAMPENLPLPQATSDSQVLDPAKVRDIMRNLPPDAEGLDWRLTYSTSLHGFSLRTLFYRCSLNPKDEGSVQTSLTSSYTPSDQVSAFSSIHPCLLVLCTSEGETFGAMLNAHPYASGGRFYGNGSCYVFRWVKPPRTEDSSTINASATEHPQTEYAEANAAESTAMHIPDEELMKLVHQGHEIENLSEIESDESTEKGIDVSREFGQLLVLDDAQADERELESQPPATFEKFTWSGKNNFFIRGDHNSLTIGCAQGHSALRLDDVLLHGRTETCETFDSPPLCSTEDFIINNLEVWSFF
ncbi:oxidation resistance protein 1 [Clonorchis sinensis]|uniref:Oxidation resistance protein 1 n=1 Tax=Clonorchis sinensis TaxID=79923 RepID=H2KTZ3_CLOSI|nr:oxidation resistance protein 1 [Clonorchis sinensis]